MFLALKRHGHEIEMVYPGIYYITNNLPFPVQVIVTKELKKETHSSLRILSNNAEREDVERFLEMSVRIKTPWGRNYVDSVLQASARANFELYENLRRESAVSSVFRELFRDEVEEMEEKARKTKESAFREGQAQIIVNLHKNGFTPEQIASATNKTLEDVNDILFSKDETHCS